MDIKNFVAALAIGGLWVIAGAGCGAGYGGSGAPPSDGGVRDGGGTPPPPYVNSPGGRTALKASDHFPVLTNLGAQPTFSVSTVPANGDINPYGVAFVPSGFPSGNSIRAGDILVSNFNNANNLQGTGTTIVRIDSAGQQSLFFQSSEIGLTTALGVLQAGFVLVGHLPSPKGSCVTGPQGQAGGVSRGSLLVIDGNGTVVTKLTSEALLDGPWDLTINDLGDSAHVFVSNVLTGTVTRIDLNLQGRKLAVTGMVQIASGYTHRCDPAALVVGPTGLALDPGTDTLYVSSAGDNAIYTVPNASSAIVDQGQGSRFIHDTTHLHGPLGLARVPNGDLISAQGDAVNPDPNQPSEIVEFDASGNFISQFPIDPGPGSAFGLALLAQDDGFTFAAVDDGLNVLDIWVVP